MPKTPKAARAEPRGLKACGLKACGLKAFKLLRLRADGTLGPLFVGRGLVLRVGETCSARADLPHPGLAHRPGFHCTAEPRAPHIKLRLKNGERRVWCEVRLTGWVTPHMRPECQGGLWYTAEKMKIVRQLPRKEET